MTSIDLMYSLFPIAIGVHHISNYLNSFSSPVICGTSIIICLNCLHHSSGKALKCSSIQISPETVLVHSKSHFLYLKFPLLNNIVFDLELMKKRLVLIDSSWAL